jgi:hypothetical protein
MSGAGAKGAHQRVRVYQTGHATYAAGNFERNGLVDVDSRLGRQAKTVLIGLRIRNDQDILDFKLFGKKGNTTKQIPLIRQPPGGAIANQLAVVAGAAGEQWIGYEAQYDQAEHGQNGFTTVLKLSNFTAAANGFQEVPVAFTYKDPAGNEFTAGHYVVGTSILPGQNADPEPPPENPPKPAARKKAVAKKKAAGGKKKSGQGAKKKTAARGKPTRKRR